MCITSERLVQTGLSKKQAKMALWGGLFGKVTAVLSMDDRYCFNLMSGLVELCSAHANLSQVYQEKGHE